MPIVTMNFLYLGNFADVDPDESNTNAENAAGLLGAYDELSVVVVDANDADGDGVIYDDEFGTGETLSYDAGSGSTTSELDSSMLYNVTVTLGDGTTRSLELLVIQTQAGDVFVRDVVGGDSLDNLNIQAISLDSVSDPNGAGFVTAESVESARVVCFAAGTRILTATGPRLVEHLCVGDHVMTLDHGPQEALWIARRRVAHPGRNAPVEISAGALGAGLPTAPLRLSPQHRVMLRNRVALRMFGAPEVLVNAGKLVGLRGIDQSAPATPVTYFHFAYLAHELVLADGAYVESFLPGPLGLAMLPRSQRRALFDVLSPQDIKSQVEGPARFCPTPKQQRKLIERLQKNQRCLLEPEGTPPQMALGA